MSKQNKKTKNMESSTGKKQSRNKQLLIILSVAVIVILGVFFFTSVNKNSSKKVTERVAPQEEEISYDLRAEKLFQRMKLKMAQPISPYMLILKSINKVEDFTWLALDEDTTNTAAWERLAYVNSHFHGKQALLRYESYMNQNLPDKVKEEEKNAIMYFAKANLYYDKALEFGSKDSANVYLLKSETAEIQRIYDYSAINLQEAIDLKPDVPMYRAKIIEAYLKGGRYDLALRQIEKYKKLYPESDIPYIHHAGYYYNTGDTLAAIKSYEIAIEKGTKPDVVKFVQHYYKLKGDEEKANYYLQKVQEAQVNYDPEQY